MPAGATAAKEQATKKSPLDQAVQEFERDYAEAWSEVIKVKETTETPAWRELYANERRDQRTEREKLARQLEELTESFKTHGSSEDLEKELGDIKKQMVELREHIEGWRARVVYPLRKYVDECGNIIAKYMSRARDMENQSPLQFRDAVDIMRTAQETRPRATWNNEDGIVEIVQK